MSLALKVLLGLIVACSSGSFAQDIPTHLYQPTGSCEVKISSIICQILLAFDSYFEGKPSLYLQVHL